MSQLDRRMLWQLQLIALLILHLIAASDQDEFDRAKETTGSVQGILERTDAPPRPESSANTTVPPAYESVTNVRTSPRIVKLRNGRISRDSILCEADGVPTPTTLWYRNEVQVKTTYGNVYQSSGRLNVKNAAASDAGNYTCQATNTIDNIQQHAEAFAYILASPTITISPMVAVLGQDATKSITCEASGWPTPKVTWWENATKVGNDQNSVYQSRFGNRSKLMLAQATRSDGGVYTCKARNYFEDEMIPSGRKTAELQVPPQITRITPISVTFVNGGGTGPILCEASGFPEPLVSWYRGNRKLSNTNRNGVYQIVTKSLSTLILDSATKEAVGEYTCSAKNIVGASNQVKWANKTAFVYLKATITPFSPSTVVLGARPRDPIMCKASGYPPPTVSWSKDGSDVELSGATVTQTISTGRSDLILSGAIKESDAGEYRCKAVNTHAGKEISTVDSRAQVQFAAEIHNITPGAVLFSERSGTRQISCQAKGYPEPEVHWYKNGRKVTSRSTSRVYETTSGSSCTLQLAGATEDDAGTYSCSAKNTVGERNEVKWANRTAYLYLAAEVRVDQSKAFITDRSERYITCHVLGVPTAAHGWYKNDIQITGDRISEQSSGLRLKYSKESDAGIFKCKASNTIERVSYTSEKAVGILVKARMPSINPTTVVLGRASGSIRCEASGYPTPIVSWFKDGREVRPSQTGVTQKKSDGSSELILSRAKTSDAGEYTCKVTNEYEGKEISSHRKNAQVQVAAEITSITPETVNFAQRSQTTQISCQASGYPKPEVSWYQNEREVQLGTRYNLNSLYQTKGSSRSTLKLARATEADAGSYTCSSRNRVGETNQVKWANRTAFLYLDVRITRVNPPMVVLGRASVSIICEASGYPTPIVSWAKDGSDVETSHTSVIQTKSSGRSDLILSDAKKSDAGEYICNAVNTHKGRQISSDNRNAQVHVAAEISSITPGAVTFSELSQTSQIECQAFGYPEPEMYWYRNNELDIVSKISSYHVYEITIGTTSTLNLTWATKNDAGSYTCYAKNTVGMEDEVKLASSEAFLYLAAEVVQITPTTTVYITEGKARYVTCETVGVPTPKVGWYKNESEILGDGISRHSSGLRLEYSQGSDAGVYTCKAKNTIEGQERTSEKTAKIFLPVKLVGSHPNSEYVDYDTWANLSCTFEGFPTPSVRWILRRKNFTDQTISKDSEPVFRISQILSQQPGGIQQVTSNLTIFPARLLGRMEVFCGGTNNGGTKYKAFIVNEGIYLHGNKHYYFSRRRIYYSHSDGTEYCKSIGGKLANIPDQNTQDFIAKTFPESVRFVRIGTRRNNVSGHDLWEWVDGITWYNETEQGRWNETKGRRINENYVGWKTNFPEPNREKKCAVLEKASNFEWINHECDEKLKIACEIPAVGLPTEVRISSPKCKPDVTVKWKPHVLSVDIPHRLSISPANVSNSAKRPAPVIVIPTNRPQQEYNFTTLTPSTKYIVQITLCPDYCTSQTAESYEITTGSGIIADIEGADASQTDRICRVKWTVDNSKNSIVDEYKLAVSSNYVFQTSSPSVPAVQNLRFDSTVLFHEMVIVPNRNYTFRVVATNCAGDGKSVKANGICMTEPEAPLVVMQPQISKEIDLQVDSAIEVFLPDETRGPVSCLFIIVQIGHEVGFTSGFSLGDLEQAEAAATAENLEKGSVYIAIALSRSNFSGQSIETTLGDEATSRCNLDSEPEFNRRKRSLDSSEYEGRNRPLKKGTEYSLFTVSATPSNNGFILKQSEPTVFSTKSSVSGLLWLIGVVLPVLLLLIAVTAVCFFLKRKQKNKVTEEIDMPALPRQDMVDESPYVNAPIMVEADSKTTIKLKDLHQTYNSMSENNYHGFEEEFQALKFTRLPDTLTTLVASGQAMKSKNRYKNILPYDQTRVILTGIKADDGYINACYINGFRQKKKFIATQGPLPQTIKDFWTMIRQRNCNVIVMLTGCIERGKRKCEKYWPDVRSTVTYGNLTIRNVEESTAGCYIKRKLEVTGGDRGKGIVYQYHFVKWPDHGVPVTTSGIFRLHNAVMGTHIQTGGSFPIVVHCSAGAGRTGALIALDILSAESRCSRKVDVFECVLNMRKQRVDMVQALDQYILIHKLILENSLFQTTGGSIDAVRMKLEELERSPSKNAIEDEFSHLSVIGPLRATKYGDLPEYDLMNRDPEIIPYEHSKVIVLMQPEDERAVYINASTIETYDDSLSLIVAQGPLPRTIKYFWRAVFDNHVNTIVMLTEFAEHGEEQCANYLPSAVGRSLTFGNLSVALVGHEAGNDITTRRFRLTRGDSTKDVLHLQLTGWKSTSCPDSAYVVLDLINRLISNVKAVEGASGLIHCSDGAGRTGAFCVILNAIEQMSSENSVDIFRAAKDLRDCRPGMIRTIDQYIFCHRALIHHISSINPYANFGQ